MRVKVYKDGILKEVSIAVGMIIKTSNRGREDSPYTFWIEEFIDVTLIVRNVHNTENNAEVEVLSSPHRFKDVGKKYHWEEEEFLFSDLITDVQLDIL